MGKCLFPVWDFKKAKQTCAGSPAIGKPNFTIDYQNFKPATDVSKTYHIA